MSVFLVQLADESPGTRQATSFVVSAEDAADARAIAESQFDGDAGPAAFAAATVTDLTTGELGNVNTSPNMLGYKLRVSILDSTPVIDEEVVGAGSDDTLDELGDLMVIALNANAIIANAAFVSPDLTIAGVADNLGDRKVQVTLTPPGEGAVPIPGPIGIITDEGIVAAALAVALTVAAETPQVYDTFKR